MPQFQGGCSCGSVRYSIGRAPLWVSACHCDSCKKRTGSAYGLSLVIEKADVGDFSGATTIYTRTGDSGNKVHYEFCPRCGSTIRWYLDVMPSRQMFALGTLDDYGDIKVHGEYYVKAALPWARLGCPLSCDAAPDMAFRQRLVELARAGPAPR